MLSTSLELLGFAALVAATYLLGGLAAGLIALGLVLLLTGYATEDDAAALALRRATAPVSVRARRLRERRRARREQRASAVAGG